jgi:hypothetical protein
MCTLSSYINDGFHLIKFIEKPIIHMKIENTYLMYSISIV